ncbi:MAG: hypothetical protein K2X54_09280 [Methylobacterium organophilum]|nr:hypothetical protein [Methylobacterium organophilum]
MFAELCERVMDASLESDFDLSRRFVPVEGKGRRYWYFDRIVDGANRRAYVGPAADEEITRRVEDFRNLKNDRQARRKLVPTLVREAEFPRPESMTGDIVAAVAKAGLFKLRGMLVGTVAFQCLSGVLGVRLPSAAMQTADANFAQFHSISAAVGDSLPPMLNFLHEVDPSFHDVPRIAGGRASTQFASATGYKVEFLLPNYGKDEYGDTPAHMPAIGRAAAQPLRYLDFLIHEPVRSVLLHKSGIPVTVPAPERFAVHKIIVAVRRNRDAIGYAKSSKDLHRAEALASALGTVRRHSDLAMAWTEAWERGLAWREALESGISYMRSDQRDVLERTLEEGLEEIDALDMAAPASSFAALGALIDRRDVSSSAVKPLAVMDRLCLGSGVRPSREPPSPVGSRNRSGSRERSGQDPDRPWAFIARLSETDGRCRHTQAGGRARRQAARTGPDRRTSTAPRRCYRADRSNGELARPSRDCTATTSICWRPSAETHALRERCHIPPRRLPRRSSPRRA